MSTIAHVYDESEVLGMSEWVGDRPLDDPFDDAVCWLSAQDVPDHVTPDEGWPEPFDHDDLERQYGWLARIAIGVANQ